MCKLMPHLFLLFHAAAAMETTGKGAFVLLGELFVILTEEIWDMEKSKTVMSLDFSVLMYQ